MKKGAHGINLYYKLVNLHTAEFKRETSSRSVGRIGTRRLFFSLILDSFFPMHACMHARAYQPASVVLFK